jgi:hypothetical protein
MGSAGTVRPRNLFRGLIQTMSGDMAQPSRQFDSSSSTDFGGLVGMRANLPAAISICFEAVSKAVKGTS